MRSCIGFIAHACRSRPCKGVRFFASAQVLTDEVSPDLLVGASLGWGMTITTNDQLVDTLQESGLVKNERVAAAMRAMDRAWFAPQEERGKSSAPLPGEGCYALNKPTKLGFGATMSSPQIQAELLELIGRDLDLTNQENQRAIDIGCGSGYLTACLAHMLGPSGRVWGVDHMTQLVQLAEGSFERVALEHPNITASFVVGSCFDPELKIDSEEDILFDRIAFGAAVEEIPQHWLHSLKLGGRLVAPLAVGGRHSEQSIVVVERVSVEGDDPEQFLHREVEQTKTVCSTMFDQTEDQWEDAKDRLAKVQGKLLQWKQEFEVEQGRPPTAEEMIGDQVAGELFKEFQSLRKLS